MKLTPEEVIGKYESSVTPEYRANINNLVVECNRLMDLMIGVEFHVNPLTGNIISGETLGGMRPQNCPIGSPNSAHKVGMAVDIYDPNNEIDLWLMMNQAALENFNLWFEVPSSTPRWSHWTIRSPNSRRRFFYP